MFHDLFIFKILENYCPCPPAPTNGSRNCSESTEVAAYSRLHYKCNSGYHVVGDEYRTCHPSGDWTVTTPDCVKGDGNNIKSNAMQLHTYRAKNYNINFLSKPQRYLM